MTGNAQSSPTLLPQEELDKTALPLLEAYTLPPECYWAPEFYEAELEHIFHRSWLCIGRVEDVPEPGDFKTLNVAGEPIVLVRDGEGEVRVHLNVCRHRGCQVAEGSGKAKTFRCPYHGWMYGLTGELRGTPDFSETLNFDKKDYPLISVKVEIWEGFIMINFDDDASPYHEDVSNVTAFEMDKYQLADQVTTQRWEWDIPCNWKVYVENYDEEYHTPWVHPETLQTMAPMKGWIEFPQYPQGQPWDLLIGQFPGFTMSDSGEPILPVIPATAELAPEHQGLTVWLSYPGFGVLNGADCSLYYQLHPTGPESFRLRVGLMLPSETAKALEAGDPDIVAAVEMYGRNAAAFIEEDNEIAVKQQGGLRSRLAARGRYCKHEGLVWEFNKWVIDKAYRANGLGNGATNGHAGS